MVKRAVIGILWTYAAYGGWKLGAEILALPQYLDLLAMVASATLGSVMGLRVGRRMRVETRRIARIPERAIPADGVLGPNPQG